MKAMKGIAGALTLALLLAVVLVSGAAPAAAQDNSRPAVGSVTGLTASSEGMADGAVRVRWLGAERAQVYFVAYIRSDDAAAGSYGGAQMAAFNGTEGIIDGLDGGVSYDFIVVGMRWDLARYEPVWGEWSNRSAATPGGTAPAEPRPALPTEPQRVGRVTDLSVNAQGQQAGAVRVSWTPAENAQVYFVIYIPSDDADDREYAGVQTAVFNGTDGIIDGLGGGVLYDFIAIGMRWNWGEYGTVWGRWSQWQSAKAIGMPANLGAAAGDWAALIALYHATDGDNWNASYNWLSDAPLGEWYGVTTDQEGRVIRLVLGRWNDPAGIIGPFGPDLNLAGELPAELGNLTRLQELSLGVNQLVGDIPPELGRLSRLTTLDLNNNRLTGEIPPELGNLAGLQGVHLSNNVLTGAIPAELGRLSNLRTLDLRDNVLTGTIPAELGNLSNLDALYLAHNILTGAVPMELGNLSRLEWLSLAGNQFTGCLPAVWRAQADYPNTDLAQIGLPWCEAAPGDRAEAEYRLVLETLYRATDGPNWHSNDNWLSDAPVNEWSGVDVTLNGRVKGLHLEDNGLTGEIPAELGNLASLETLRLGGNNLTGAIPADLAGMTSLRVLSLSNNRLMGTIPSRLGSMAHLAELRLDGNELTGEIPPELGSLVNLRELYLYQNELTGAIPPELGNLVNLLYLYLYDNRLTGAIPPELGNLASLERLYLTGNKLTGDIPGEFGRLGSLRYLNLDINRLTGSIPAELGNLDNLEELHLRHNRLTGSIPAELGGLTLLRILSISHNVLTGTIPTELGRLSRLNTLYLNDNLLVGSIPPELGNLSNLSDLRLYVNQLTGSIPAELGKLDNLAYLYLRDNSLSGCIPAALRAVDSSDLANLGLPFCAR